VTYRIYAVYIVRWKIRRPYYILSIPDNSYQ